MARTITCSCGATLTAKDDEELFRMAGQHMAEKHPDMKMTEAEARAFLKANARDA